MTFFLQSFQSEIPYPAKETPAWAAKSDRWYQLDAPAYSLAQAFDLMKADLGVKPDFLILASPRASNLTDRDFAASGASSPSKFVHTLPNIRASSLLQVMEWAGPMLCVQNDPQTIVSALEEAFVLFEAEEALKRIWVVAFEPTRARCHYFIVTREPSVPSALTVKVTGSASGAVLGAASPAATPGVKRDEEWLDWVYNKPSNSFNLSRHYTAQFTSGV
jgi:hypothetical protein